MLNRMLIREVDMAMHVLHGVLPYSVRNERPWLNQVNEDILSIIAMRHLLKTGMFQQERDELLTAIAHRRLELSPVDAALEADIHLVDHYRFRQPKAMAGIEANFPKLYTWLQTANTVTALLWHRNDPVFRRLS